MSSVLLLTDPLMDRHAAPGHPERPERREAVVAGVRDAAGDSLVERLPAATDEDLATLVHDADYLAELEAIERQGGGWLDPDTYLVPGSLDAARAAAATTADAARTVARGEAQIGFAVVRPPGHHAMPDRTSGFCLVNSIAVAVAALRRDAGVRRIGIVDWDVHHGDGTQVIFDADADVWYGSTHQQPLFPGTGARSETGVGEAIGTKHNRPLAPGSDDEVFTGAWLDQLLPSLEAFGPDAILVSAGYDAHRADPLASLAVTEAGYETVARALGALAGKLDLPGVALTLEGGYDLAALRSSATATIRGLIAGRSQAES